VGAFSYINVVKVPLIVNKIGYTEFVGQRQGAVKECDVEVNVDKQICPNVD
jgi:hypothetical protein